MHPYGRVSLNEHSSDYIGHDLLLKNFSNIDINRKTSFFPYLVEKMNASRNALLNGYMRVFGDVVEYDIIFKFGNEANYDPTKIFAGSADLTANVVTFQLYAGLSRTGVGANNNLDYFANASTTDIFAYENPDDTASTA